MEMAQMNIRVNGTVVEIFAGARVADVLRKYSPAEWQRVREKRLAVCDGGGHEVALDGELNGGESLFLKDLEVTP